MEESDHAGVQTADTRRNPFRTRGTKEERQMYTRRDEIQWCPVSALCDKQRHLSALFWLEGRGRVRGEEAVAVVVVVGGYGGGSGHLYRLWRGQPRDRNYS